MQIKILIIEDNEDIRENTAELLELANYDVTTAENGKEGIKKAKEVIPNLIICDIMMPELDGYGVLNMLSKIKETASIPFIFLTAKADKHDFRKGMSLGADDYLTKPFDESDLINTIELRLKKHQTVLSSSKHTTENFEQFLKENSSSLASLVEEKRIKKVRKKEFIFHTGDYASSVFLLKKGKLKAYSEDEYGKEYITELISEGEYFGYKDILINTERSNSVVALEDSEIIKIPRKDFEELIFNNKEVAIKFIQLLSGNVKEKEERLLRLAFQSVRMRVRDALLLIRDKFKEEHNDSLVKISFSRDDLAAIVGTSTETLIRTLSEFKNDGLISSKKRQIVLINEKGLEDMTY